MNPWSWRALVIVVVSAGFLSLADVGAASAATPAPITRPLTIQTVPAVGGARFVLDGQTLVTGRDGTVRTTTSKEQRDALATDRAAHLSVASPDIAIRSGVRAKFSGWYDGGYHYDSTNKSGQILRAAFDFDYLTSFSFVRPNGTSVQPLGFDGMQLQAAAGAATIAVPKIAPIWLRGIKVAANAGHLAVTDVEYKISSLKLNGSNVVHVDQQRFLPSHEQRVTIQLLLFTVTLNTHDAFFGFNLGSSVDLKFADGSVKQAPIRHGSVTFSDLPRGGYALKVHAPGLASDKSLTISRNQVVTLQVISWLDIAALIVIFFLLSGTLLFIGRSRRHGRLASRERTSGGVVSIRERVLERSARAT